MSNSNGGEDQLWQAVLGIFVLLLTIVFGLFLLSQWLTNLLFKYLLNPLLNGLLDRHDGAVILLSAGLWGGVAAAILFPLAVSQEIFGPAPADLPKIWLGMTVAGTLWGVAAGVWVLGSWWAEAESQMPVGYDVVQLLDAPLEIHQPASPAFSKNGRTGSSVPNDEMLEELILGDALWS